MIGAAVMALGIVASAIQFGWQPLNDGGQEYIVQVEPELTALDAFRKEGFSSDVPPQLRDIRRIRIVVGSDPLPHQGEMAPALGNTTGSAAQTSPKPAPHAKPPEKLPAGMSAMPLDAAHPANPASPGVALADGHQPARNAANSAEPSAAGPVHPAVHPADNSKTHGPSEKAAGENSQPAAPATQSRPWLALVLVAGGLIVSLSGNVFLGWVHWGTRNQYRALVSQFRSQRSA